MKLIIIILSIFLFSGCQAFHVTKQYYNEYVNPKASIDYDDFQDADIPSEFLENYYQIDSKLISLCNQMNIIESILEVEWFDTFSLTYPWVKNIGFYDTEGMFISGSDLFAYDSSIRQLITEKEKVVGNTFSIENNRMLLINTIETKLDTYRFVILEVDFSELTGDGVDKDLTIVIDDQVIFGRDLGQKDVAVEKIFTKRDYSGKMTIHGEKMLWVRSYAADNLAYFFPR